MMRITRCRPTERDGRDLARFVLGEFGVVVVVVHRRSSVARGSSGVSVGGLASGRGGRHAAAHGSGFRARPRSASPRCWGPACSSSGRPPRPQPDPRCWSPFRSPPLIAALNATSTTRLAMRHPVSGGAYAYGRAELGPDRGVRGRAAVPPRQDGVGGGDRPGRRRVPVAGSRARRSRSPSCSCSPRSTRPACARPPSSAPWPPAIVIAVLVVVLVLSLPGRRRARPSQRRDAAPIPLGVLAGDGPHLLRVRRLRARRHAGRGGAGSRADAAARGAARRGDGLHPVGGDARRPSRRPGRRPSRGERGSGRRARRPGLGGRAAHRSRHRLHRLADRGAGRPQPHRPRDGAGRRAADGAGAHQRAHRDAGRVGRLRRRRRGRRGARCSSRRRSSASRRAPCSGTTRSRTSRRSGRRRRWDSLASSRSPVSSGAWPSPSRRRGRPCWAWPLTLAVGIGVRAVARHSRPA